jgi:hypothetical protein
MKKDFLILQACGHKDEPLETDNIRTQAELYGMTTIVKCINDSNILKQVLENSGSFDYIYLSTHGDEAGFCNESRSLNMNWGELAGLICETNCLKESSILLLSCCRGGLNEVAYDMFWHCPNIEYVVGPRQSLTSDDLLIGFNLLLYNLEHRHVDPIVACEKVLKGTDIRFKCFDRMETMSDSAYIVRKAYLDKKLEDQENEIE